MSTSKEFNLISGLDPLQTASVPDIRRFFFGLLDLTVDQSETSTRPLHTGSELSPDSDPREEVQAMLDDLTIVFRRALERGTADGSIGLERNLDAVAQKLTGTFRSVLFMQHDGYERDEIRRFIELALKILD
ncbi:MAG: hypothetical protein WBN31_00145 [Gammaproteobacteria bacterium]